MKLKCRACIEVCLLCPLPECINIICGETGGRPRKTNPEEPEPPKSHGWGGKRKGAGRKKGSCKKKTVPLKKKEIDVILSPEAESAKVWDPLAAVTDRKRRIRIQEYIEASRKGTAV